MKVFVGKMTDFNTAMFELGILSTFDRSKLSKATCRSIQSHINTLTRNNVPIDEEHLAYNTVAMLNRLVGKTGEKLKDPYKRQIGMTIKRFFPNAHINLKRFNKTRNNKTNNRMSDPDFAQLIKKLIEYAATILNRMDHDAIIEDIGLYDTCVAILIITSTCLRLHEACQLTLGDIVKIRNHEAVYIKSKGDSNARIIAENEVLAKVLKLVQKQRNKIEDAVLIKKSDYATQHQLKRLAEQFIIISSEDYMRKKLRTLSATVYHGKQTLGFNMFRKYTTSLLIDGGGYLVAQALNNHSSVNTTLDHYNVVGPQTVQNTYNDIMGALNVNKLSEHEINADIIRSMEESKRKTIKLREKLNPNSFENYLKNNTTSTITNTRPSTSSSASFNIGGELSNNKKTLEPILEENYNDDDIDYDNSIDVVVGGGGGGYNDDDDDEYVDNARFNLRVKPEFNIKEPVTAAAVKATTNIDENSISIDPIRRLGYETPSRDSSYK